MSNGFYLPVSYTQQWNIIADRLQEDVPGSGSSESPTCNHWGI